MRRIVILLAAVFALAIPMAAASHVHEHSFASTCQAWIHDGHEHRDVIIGSSICDMNDTFRGLYGDDELWGNGGADFLRGARGNDELRGGPGNDELYGDEERDFLYGATGNDDIYGGPGNDFIDCGGGTADQAWGGGGDDTFTNCDGNAVE